MKNVTMFQILIILMFVSCSISNDWKTYTDNANHFTMKYPESWTQKAMNKNIAFLSPREDENDLFQENVNLILQDLSKHPMTIDQYSLLTKSQVISNVGPGAVFSLKNTIVAGHDAKEFIYEMNYNGHSLKIKQYWFIKDNIAYLFTFTAQPSKFSKYESIAAEMVRSFKFF